MQQSDISSNMVSNRDQKAVDHCGAVIFVGSVLTRDLYDGGEREELSADSVESK